MESQACRKGRCFLPFVGTRTRTLIFALESSPPILQLSNPEMVAVAQLVEPLIVIQVVAGSSPVGRPTLPAFFTGLSLKHWRDTPSPNSDQRPCLARYPLT